MTTLSKPDRTEVIFNFSITNRQILPNSIYYSKIYFIKLEIFLITNSLKVFMLLDRRPAGFKSYQSKIYGTGQPVFSSSAITDLKCFVPLFMFSLSPPNCSKLAKIEIKQFFLSFHILLTSALRYIQVFDQLWTLIIDHPASCGFAKKLILLNHDCKTKCDIICAEYQTWCYHILGK